MHSVVPACYLSTTHDPACNTVNPPLQMLHFRSLAMCDTAGSTSSWSQEQGHFRLKALALSFIVFLLYTQCDFSQSCSPCHSMPKKDITVTQEVLRAIKPQRDLVLRFKKTAVISSYLQGMVPAINTLTTVTSGFPTGIRA